MASNVDIANRALTKLGARRILALSDNTKEAREMNAVFDTVLDSELRAKTWRFTIKRAQIAANSTAPAFGFNYAYPVPADFLRIIQVGDFYPGAELDDYITGDVSLYSLENGLILTDLDAPLNLRYVARIEDPTLFDPNFVEVLACKLAMETCEAITQSSSKLDQVTRGYMMGMQAAVRANAIELAPVKVADDTFIMARV